MNHPSDMAGPRPDSMDTSRYIIFPLKYSIILTVIIYMASEHFIYPASAITGHIRDEWLRNDHLRNIPQTRVWVVFEPKPGCLQHNQV